MSTDTALLVIDVQVGMFPDDDPVYAGDRLLAKISYLIEKARTCDIPIIYIQHNEGEGEPLQTHTVQWGIHPAVKPAPSDTIIQKCTPDSFYETNLQQVLSAKGIHKLVVGGIQTDLCVAATCRRASGLGYQVLVVQDAHSTWKQGDLTAAAIIEQYNEEFRNFAEVEESAKVEFYSS